MTDQPYITLRCRAERHEICPTRPDTRCTCYCHWTLFNPNQEIDEP